MLRQTIGLMKTWKISVYISSFTNPNFGMNIMYARAGRTGTAGMVLAVPLF